MKVQKNRYFITDTINIYIDDCKRLKDSCLTTLQISQHVVLCTTHIFFADDPVLIQIVIIDFN